MLRPSPIIGWMARRPSAVPGILTIRFGRAMRSCRSRAAALGARGVVGQAGATSTLTKPSPPSLSWYTGANSVAAPR